MGPIFILIIAAAVGLLLLRLLPETDSVFATRRMIGSAAGAFIGAWLTGSLLQRSSFLSGNPDPVTLLGGLGGAVIGVFAAIAVSRVRQR